VLLNAFDLVVRIEDSFDRPTEESLVDRMLAKESMSSEFRSASALNFDFMETDDDAEKSMSRVLSFIHANRLISIRVDQDALDACRNSFQTIQESMEPNSRFTPRFESFLKIAKGFARIELRDHVTEDDVFSAQELMHSCLSSLKDVIKRPRTQRKGKNHRIKEFLDHLGQSSDPLIPKRTLLHLLDHYGLESAVLDSLNEQGILVQKSGGFFEVHWS
jgi:DNA replicative helicase MCM subunit Mcm2 (Cdc46/Mcm family)